MLRRELGFGRAQLRLQARQLLTPQVGVARARGDRVDDGALFLRHVRLQLAHPGAQALDLAPAGSKLALVGSARGLKGAAGLVELRARGVELLLQGRRVEHPATLGLELADARLFELADLYQLLESSGLRGELAPDRGQLHGQSGEISLGLLEPRLVRAALLSQAVELGLELRHLADRRDLERVVGLDRGLAPGDGRLDRGELGAQAVLLGLERGDLILKLLLLAVLLRDARVEGGEGQGALLSASPQDSELSLMGREALLVLGLEALEGGAGLLDTSGLGRALFLQLPQLALQGLALLGEACLRLGAGVGRLPLQGVEGHRLRSDVAEHGLLLLARRALGLEQALLFLALALHEALLLLFFLTGGRDRAYACLFRFHLRLQVREALSLLHDGALDGLLELFFLRAGLAQGRAALLFQVEGLSQGAEICAPLRLELRQLGLASADRCAQPGFLLFVTADAVAERLLLGLELRQGRFLRRGGGRRPLAPVHDDADRVVFGVDGVERVLSQVHDDPPGGRHMVRELERPDVVHDAVVDLHGLVEVDSRVGDVNKQTGRVLQLEDAEGRRGRVPHLDEREFFTLLHAYRLQAVWGSCP